jgi:predicted NAD-dependent protein-ADP-ribosyltransferase YbiA (DUF1768 family)
MGLRDSSEKFNESYKAVSGKYPMSKALQDYSFLNRWFIFRRRTVGKLVEMPITIAQNPSSSSVLAPEAELVQIAKATEINPDSQQVSTTRPIYKFFHNAVLKDDLKVGRKDWARYISTPTLSNLHDINDPTILYPSLDAAFASALFQVATDKPELGPNLFSTNSNIHQTLLRKLKEEPATDEKRKAELLEEELIAIRNQIKPAEIKRIGAKYNEAKWAEKREQIMQQYIQQRYDTDSEFKRIMDTIKVKNGILVYYHGPKPSELGGLIRDNNVIEGQNKLGIMYMRTVGLRP